MYTQFFGTYLLSKNYVNTEQLFDAMQKLSSQHMKLGTLAIHAGLMTASEVLWLSRLIRTSVLASLLSRWAI